MRKLLSLVIITLLLFSPMLSFATDVDVEQMSDSQLMELRLSINNELASRIQQLDAEKAQAGEKPLRELVPNLLISKYIRDEIGLISVDQIPSQEQLERLTRFTSTCLNHDDRVDTIEGLQYFPNLKSVWLSSLYAIYFDEVTELPEGFYSLTNLKELSLSATSIKHISEEVGNLVNLESLYLEEMKIEVLPDSIGNLQNLKSLDLRKTEISELPDSICNLTNLKKLNLSGSHIEKLPDDIGNLTNLEELDISNTKITQLPPSIFNLENLKTFKREGLDLE